MILTEQSEVIKCIAPLAMSKQVFKELAEPLLYEDGDIWWCDIFCRETVSFCCINIDGRLKYLYTKPELRGNGMASKMLKDADIFCQVNNINELRAVCPKSALDFYLNRGWVINRSFTNYFKIQKTENEKRIIQNYQT